MKLATYKDGSRDGRLVVVSRDLALAHYSTSTASRLQPVLDDWNFLSPQLQDLYVSLNQGKARHAFAFDPQQCMAPLPRAYQWASGSAYLSQVERLCAASGAPLPDGWRSDPRLVQGGSDDFLGPADQAWFGSAAWGIDFESGLAVITDDVAMGASPSQALDGVRLLMLANGWTLRQGMPAELAGGFGLLHSKPAAAFSPVAVTPDELGEAWRGGRVHLTMQTSSKGKKVGLCEAGPDMDFDFGQLIAHLAKTRNLRAGTVVGSGPVSNRDAARGYGCIAEKRALESLAQGEPRTPYLVMGDRIRIEMKGLDGLSMFGAIDQGVGGPLDLSQPPDAPADSDNGA
jgi:fumarylacetoacetate (FAA) hydrolase